MSIRGTSARFVVQNGFVVQSRVEAFNRQIRAIEATVRENCQGFKETWEKAKR